MNFLNTGICNETRYQDHGFITSPGYPKPYPLEIRCMWRVQAPKDIRIAFWLRDFYLEVGSIIYPYCKNDFLYFRVSFFV